ncbi:hypothetical protein SHXM_08438 [Streptomyces hygroscopicus]|nr:hypothetical protein SHXM_08438 [Streptomyces hygroscopicus]
MTGGVRTGRSRSGAAVGRFSHEAAVGWFSHGPGRALRAHGVGAPGSELPLYAHDDVPEAGERAGDRGVDASDMRHPHRMSGASQAAAAEPSVSSVP